MEAPPRVDLLPPRLAWPTAGISVALIVAGAVGLWMSEESDRAGIELRLDLDGDLVFSVGDDGEGFDPVATAAGEGLRIMADRSAAFGGSLTVDSGPGCETTVTGRVAASQLELSA